MRVLKAYPAVVILSTLLFANVFIWHAVLADSEDTLTVAFLDVGQGDSIFIEAPNGNQMLIDGGRGKRVIRELSNVMLFYDRSIDIVVSSHPDADHIGGLPHVFDRYKVAAYVSTNKTNDTNVFKTLQKKVEAEQAEQVIAHAGKTIKLSEDVYIDILFPQEDAHSWDSNDSSIIMRVAHGETSVMLTGDAGSSIEEYLVSLYGDAITSSVLKAGHHGSDTSSAALFLGMVSPKTVIVSAGEDNQYGHPDSVVVKRITELGMDILSTAEDGTIILKSDGHTFTRDD